MSKPTARKLASLLLDEIAQYRDTARRRIDCLRAGHQPLRDWDDKRICERCKLWLNR